MKLCLNHPARKVKARGLCKSCYDGWLKKNNPEYKQRQESTTTKWARLNPEKTKVYQARRKAKDKADPLYKEKQRNKLLKRYGLNNESYAALLAKQDNSCALCFRQPEKTRFHVDHDHETGKVRGILCHQCNWYLGTVDEDPQILERIKIYIRREA